MPQTRKLLIISFVWVCLPFFCDFNLNVQYPPVVIKRGFAGFVSPFAHYYILYTFMGTFIYGLYPFMAHTCTYYYIILIETVKTNRNSQVQGTKCYSLYIISRIAIFCYILYVPLRPPLRTVPPIDDTETKVTREVNDFHPIPSLPENASPLRIMTAISMEKLTGPCLLHVMTHDNWLRCNISLDFMLSHVPMVNLCLSTNKVLPLLALFHSPSSRLGMNKRLEHTLNPSWHVITASLLHV